MTRMTQPWWQRLTDTLFGRLALLLLGTALISHVLALTLVFRVMQDERPEPPMRPPWFGAPGIENPGAAPPTFAPPSRPPHAGPPNWGIAADVGIRLSAILLAAWVAARWLVQPMQRLTQAAQALGDDIERPPMAEQGPLEVREATRILNQMQGRICAQIHDRDRFVAAVSHDLRTPLTRLRLRVENLTDIGERERFRRDIAEMDQMIAVTLDYLRGATSAEPKTPLDIEALAHTVAEDLQDQGHSVTVHGHVLPLHAQPSALRRCLNNLVDNAIRYGTCAEIRLIDSADAVCIEVRDHGPGLPDNELVRVMAPFYRIEASRNRDLGGVGLGLSIAHDIARRHGGKLCLRNAAAGGLIAALTLPRTPADPPSA
jgi:signal transduction histidine kinase